jgi:SAM-dependent methyltransferase
MSWDAAEDMAKWNAMALRFHARAHAQDGPFYLRAQSVVEVTSHQHVARVTATARRVLEIGVGGGEHIVFGGDPARHELYVGIDLDKDFARLCRDRHGIPVSVGDMSRLPFADRSFDCLIAMGVLEHVESLSNALAEAERVLEPGGAFHVLIPTNGGVAVEAFKRVVSYPTMRRNGIKRPDLVWSTLNVNDYKRIAAALQSRFDLVAQQALPFKWMPWHLSPLWVFHCTRR